MAEIEEARNNNLIKSSLQAKVEIKLSKEDKDLFENLIAADIFITSEVSFSIEKLETPKIKIENADGNKCSRCWKILPEVKPEGLCNRCEDVVKIYCS